MELRTESEYETFIAYHITVCILASLNMWVTCSRYGTANHGAAYRNYYLKSKGDLTGPEDT